MRKHTLSNWFATGHYFWLKFCNKNLYLTKTRNGDTRYQSMSHYICTFIVMSSVVEGTTSLDVTRHQCVSAMICDRLIGVSQFVNYKWLPALQVFAIFSNKEEWQQVIHQMTQGEGRKEMFYLTMHSTHFIYGHMASDIW